MSQQIQVLNLQRLNQGLPAITPAFGAAIAEAGAICLTDEAHNPEAAIKVKVKQKTEQTRAFDVQELPAYDCSRVQPTDFYH